MSVDCEHDRRRFLAGAVTAGVGWVAANAAEAQENLRIRPEQSPTIRREVGPSIRREVGPWTVWVDPREAIPEAHLDLVVPGQVFTSLSDVSAYNFVLCGHQLFGCTSAEDANRRHRLHGIFILEPTSEHHLRVFAVRGSGELMRQYHSLDLGLDRRMVVTSLTVRVDPSAASFTARCSEVAPAFRDFIVPAGGAGGHHCACSVRG